METQELASFNVVGLAVRSTNENNQIAQDITELWNVFLSENVMAQIPGKISEDIYCIYTEYESDYTKPYTVLLGCNVESLKNIPKKFKSITIENGPFKKFVAKGNVQQGSVWEEWTKIWNTDLDRAYVADFEVYGKKAQNPEDAEVDIFIGVKSA
ncbi:GyrI-like domain-containing protein [Chondrinema litorale]|uniref:GyrI-like domain-containing protein n=1 Tax=Chondrinema litorale TaxID=2994555 RepID=UPI0025436689|nr:effector binding domain-containing protein [Chondrinema litorale]UZR99444.1 effector binding domain-containing protein [Chondrinema litorale]